MDGYTHPNRFVHFHTFVYTIRHFYVNSNLYPNIQLYTGNAFLDPHAIHYPIPDHAKPIT